MHDLPDNVQNAIQHAYESAMVASDVTRGGYMCGWYEGKSQGLLAALLYTGGITSEQFTELVEDIRPKSR